MASNPRIDELRKRLEKEPGSRLFAQLAEELRKDGALDEAIRVSRDGLQKHPAYPSARMTLGRALLDTGDVAGARKEFEAVLKGAADNILASRFLGECFEALGDLDAAIARYKTTLMLAPGDKQVQARLQEIEARKSAPPPPPVQEAATEEVPEPPPIPLTQVEDESFELERSYEASAATAGMTAAPSHAEARASAPAGREAEATPVVAAPGAFELDQPYEAPTGQPSMEPAAVAPPPASAPAPVEAEPAAVPEELPLDFDFEMPATTMPLRAAPLVRAWEPPPAKLTAPEVPESPLFREAAGPPPPAEASAPIASPTLAELYFNQGFTDKAIEVYRQLLQREPGNGRARARLTELEALERHLRGEPSREAPPARGATTEARAGRRQAIEGTITRLEGFLAAVRRG